MRNIRREAALIVVLVAGLGVSAFLSRWLDARRTDHAKQLAESRLYLSGSAAKRLTLAFNGLAADWYWMRSLQYVGRKIVAHQDTHDNQFVLSDLSSLDLRLLAGLLDVATTLDPQFIPVYEYGAVILPEVDPDQAIALLNKGIAANPSSWRLHQNLGYIYWQRGEYATASAIYAAGARLPGAPSWMTAMSARLKGDAGSRDAAREMYQRLYETADDKTVKEMVVAHLMRLDSLDDRDVIRHLLRSSEMYSRDNRCPSSWRQIGAELRREGLRLDPATGAPLDPSGVPYRLIVNQCDVDLGEGSKVAR
ncbi:MAG: tetratricopeptide repeat protein [Pyrinomonadaceae bacterium]